MEGSHTLITLMYHGIIGKDSPKMPGREDGANYYDVSAENFAAQMAWLKQNSLNPVITFDDGEMNNYQVAFPLLQQHGFKGHFFVIVKRIGRPGYMGWNEIQELQKAGMHIGSHGLTHEVLTNLADSLVLEELKASKRTIELNLGASIEELSIPRGFCNDNIIHMARELGYRNVFISQKPFHVREKCIPRVAVKSDWTLERFILAMHGKTPVRERIGEIGKKAVKTILRESGYNWLRKMLIRLSQ